jgi:hypothetical protein
MSASLTIKNYSIALEALSRFPGTETISNDIRRLLQSEVEIAHEDLNEALKRRYDTTKAPTIIEFDDADNAPF